ncbi:MAG: hypothetical protein ACREC6_04930 [Hyphomicrobiaceae bacterium]
MARITVEQPANGQHIDLRVAGVASELTDPSITIRWLAANTTLDAAGWGDRPAKLLCRQRLDNGTLVLTLDAWHASHIAGGTGVKIEVPELGLSEDLAWRPVAPVPTVDPPVPAPAGFEPREDMPAKPPVLPSEAETGPREAETESRPSPVPAPPRRRLWPALAAAFLCGGFAGAAALYTATLRDRPALLGSVVRPAPQGPNTGALSERAYAPLRLQVLGLADRSPRGKLRDRVATVHDPERARNFYAEGQKASAGDVITDEAVYWFRQSVGLCDSSAVYGLGLALWRGQGAERDPVTGFQLLRLATALGQPQAKVFMIDNILKSNELSDLPQGIAARYQRSGP